MRILLGSVGLVAALVGCSAPDTVALEHRAELPLNEQARGVQITEDGAQSNVGMFGTTCDVDTSYAGVGNDYDYSDDNEFVVDSEDTNNGEAFLVITPSEVHITGFGDLDQGVSHRVDGVVDGELTHDGFVGLVPVQVENDCEVSWRDSSNTVVSFARLGVECDEDSSITTNPESGMSFVSTDSGVFQVSERGVIQLSGTANALLAWDSVADVVYEAGEGSSTISALEVNGGERWSVDLEGTVTALSDMGVSGNAVVSVLTDDDRGDFVVIDGLTGQVGAQLPTPSSAQNISVSGNGQVLAITLPDVVHYFDVNSID